MKPSYLQLCTEFYDHTKPEAGPKEVGFYENILRSQRGPLLEAMCGSGRLLIPLLRKGLKIEGVDSSPAMLKSCQERCAAQSLSVQLYNQSLQELSLPKKYSGIFIAIGSFQLIENYEEALAILKKLRAALLPGGILILETFIPWDAMKENIQGSVLPEQSKETHFEQTADFPEDSKIIHKSRVTVFFKKQLEKSYSRYEKWIHGKFSHAEEEEYSVRWYHRFEMELFLQKAGFASVKIVDASFEQNTQAVIYISSN